MKERERKVFSEAHRVWSMSRQMLAELEQMKKGYTIKDRLVTHLLSVTTRDLLILNKNLDANLSTIYKREKK